MKKRLFISLVIILVLAVSAAVFFRNAYVVPVLMYHSIDDGEEKTKLSVSPENFARQMEFLYKNHYNAVGLDKIISYIEKKENVPPRTVAITFDDGYYNNYKFAYPVLKRYNLPATIFVIVDKIGTPGWVSWRDLKEMSDSGVITIGSHTKSHAWLPTQDEKKLREEVFDSKSILENRLGRKVDFICYPLGAFNENVKGVVKEAGYKGAFGTNPGRLKPRDDIYAIKRIKISRTSKNLFVFWVEASGYYTWVKEHRNK